MTKVWFVTGSSKGFGRAFVEAALSRGDQVAATARDTDSLADLTEEYGDAVLPLALDVTDTDQVNAAIGAAHEKFGRLDVVINNAGYGLFGAAEEVSLQQVRDQMETNFFGAIAVTNAVLPILREQGSGHIIQISSVGGVTTFPTLSAYNASKWALEGYSESLAQELAGFGVNVTIVEPGGFDTDWGGASATRATPMPQYQPIHDALAKAFAGGVPKPLGFGNAILKIVDSEQPPLRVFFGEMPLQMLPGVYQQRLDTWNEWAAVSREAEGR
ncbi:SDR family oxidoreductase [Agromyces albus]|uniref:SDR family oxidoreductase n=1 Tax=Agromyces albus TaxID=205332 RepID=A0A4Q2L3I3_9MICO|nr:SDR family oxidoreductase [Agromyces albus]RXZ72017.1 SDR family oxidoreductase [Agromyces albus]